MKSPACLEPQARVSVLVALVVLSFAGTASAAPRVPVVLQCGFSLEQPLVAPEDWAVGCTGAGNARQLAWTDWGAPTVTSSALIRQRYDTTGEYDDRIYPEFPGRLTLSRIRGTTCRGGLPQYTRALVEWTVPDGFPYGETGPQSHTFDFGRPCPTYWLGADASGEQPGVGDERPRAVRFGGAPDTYYGKLRWRNWGGRKATATARSYLRPPYARTVRARVTASRPRRCGPMSFTYTRVSLRKAGSTTVLRFSCDQSVD